MLWQIKLQDKKTGEVNIPFEQQFDDTGMTSEIYGYTISGLIDELKEKLPADVIESKQIYLCNENDPHFCLAKAAS